jgi:aminoglycoside 6'-N-acetyltransferase
VAPVARLQGELVRLRPAVEADREALVAIRATPEVGARWRGDDLDAEFTEALGSPVVHHLVIEDRHGATVGAIFWEAEDDPDYRHAGLDIYLDPAVHDRGLGTDALRTLCRHLFEVEGHHRLTIDPAADNHRAIRAYEKVGFRPVGIMRQYERSPDGSWHDGLLMDLLADELVTRSDRTGGDPGPVWRAN